MLDMVYKNKYIFFIRSLFNPAIYFLHTCFTKFNIFFFHKMTRSIIIYAKFIIHKKTNYSEIMYVLNPNYNISI